MKTTTSIKIDTKLKEEASALAEDLGVSFSAVVNSMLKHFVRERRLLLEIEPELNDQTKRMLDEILSDIEVGKNMVGPFATVAELKKSLSS